MWISTLLQELRKNRMWKLFILEFLKNFNNKLKKHTGKKEMKDNGALQMKYKITENAHSEKLQLGWNICEKCGTKECE